MSETEAKQVPATETDQEKRAKHVDARLRRREKLEERLKQARARAELGAKERSPAGRTRVLDVVDLMTREILGRFDAMEGHYDDSARMNTANLELLQQLADQGQTNAALREGKRWRDRALEKGERLASAAASLLSRIQAGVASDGLELASRALRLRGDGESFERYVMGARVSEATASVQTAVGLDRIGVDLAAAGSSDRSASVMVTNTDAKGSAYC